MVDDQALSGPHSVDIVDDSDLLQEFTGICSGAWTFSCWMYIPIEFSGKSYFYMMSYYKDNISQGDLRYQVVLSFNSQSGVVKSEGFGPTLPLIMGQWVEIRVEIDLDADWFECYYNDELLDEKNWTTGSFNQNDGYFNLNSVHIWANGATSVYYDDFFLEGETGPIPNLACDGELIWNKVKPWETVQGDFTVENIGEPNSVLDWEIVEWPVFGNWTFSTDWGRLRPEDGPVTVEVTVDAPYETKTYTGVIILCAICDPNICCEVLVTLKVQKSKTINNTFLEFLQHYPNTFPILRQLLGL